MQQLTKEEAGRVTAILNESVVRLRLLSRIPASSKAVAALAETAAEIGLHDAAEELSQLAALEQEYKDALKHARQGKSSDDATVDDAVLRATYRRLAHALRVDRRAADLLPPEPAHPARGSSAAAGGSSEEASAGGRVGHHGGGHGHGHGGGSKHEGMGVFIERFGTLIELAARKLVTTRDAAKDEAVEGQNKQTRIDNAEREVALLQDELRRQRAVRSKQMEQLEESLAAVKAELVSVAKSAEQELKTMQTQGSQRTTDLNTGHTKAEATLKEQLAKLQADHKAATEAHIDAEANIRKRKVRARAEVEAAVAEHDAAVAEATKAVEDMRAAIAHEIGPIRDLKIYYEKIDAELARVDAEAKAEARRILDTEDIPFFRLKFYTRRMQKRYWEAKAKKDAIKELERKRKAKG